MRNSIVSLAAIVVVIAATATGCACPDEWEHLTLGVSLSETGEARGVTTPKWGETWEQPADQTLVVLAIWGPKDPPPSNDVFELYDVTEDTPTRVQLERLPCEEDETAEPPLEACGRHGTNSGCAYEEKAWMPTEPFEVGRSYALVHRPEAGNGRQLNTDTDLQSFTGEPAYVMTIEVQDPD